MNGLDVFVVVLGERIVAPSIAELRSRVRAEIDANCYGASDVGSRFRVKRADGMVVGTLFYNGRFEEVR